MTLTYTHSGTNSCATRYVRPTGAQPIAPTRHKWFEDIIYAFGDPRNVYRADNVSSHPHCVRIGPHLSRAITKMMSGLDSHPTKCTEFRRHVILGDAIHLLHVATMFFDIFPTASEGFLSHCRISYMEREVSTLLARTMGLHRVMIEPDCEHEPVPRDLFRAFVAVMYRTSGFEATHRWLVTATTKIVDLNLITADTGNVGPYLSYHYPQIAITNMQEPPSLKYPPPHNDAHVYRSVAWFYDTEICKAEGQTMKEAVRECSKKVYEYLRNNSIPNVHGKPIDLWVTHGYSAARRWTCKDPYWFGDLTNHEVASLLPDLPEGTDPSWVAELLGTAFTASFMDTNPRYNYERLEFLGDAVYNLATVEYLLDMYATNRTIATGDLSTKRINCTAGTSLLHCAEHTPIETIIRSRGYTPGSKANKGDFHDVADIMESTIGARYVATGDFANTCKWINTLQSKAGLS